jgi:hypothetical protein
LQAAAWREAAASVEAPAQGFGPPGGELLGLGGVDGHAAHADVSDVGHGASVVRADVRI